jgi:hypothetical protein
MLTVKHVHVDEANNGFVSCCSLGDHQAALLVDVEVHQSRGRRCLPQQRSDRLAFVQPEARDVDQTTTWARRCRGR